MPHDPLTAPMGVKRFHARLIDQARIAPDSRVLEIGCGTGNLALLAKRLHEVPFGRTELEEYLCVRWCKTILNSPSPRAKISKRFEWARRD